MKGRWRRSEYGYMNGWGVVGRVGGSEGRGVSEQVKTWEGNHRA